MLPGEAKAIAHGFAALGAEWWNGVVNVHRQAPYGLTPTLKTGVAEVRGMAGRARAGSAILSIRLGVSCDLATAARGVFGAGCVDRRRPARRVHQGSGEHQALRRRRHEHPSLF